MGNYITSEVLEERITSVRMDSLCGVTGADKTALLESVIERAEAIVDGYAMTRYHTPLKPSGLVSELTLTIAEYELYKRGSGGSIPEKIADSYKDVVEHLHSLSAGELSIPSEIPQEPAEAKGGSMKVTSNSSLFDGKSMEMF